jgi:DNA-binding SARP family transcriptional activator
MGVEGMGKLFIRLFDTPAVLHDGNIVQLSSRKSEAIIFYLLVEGMTSRDELAGMFWEEMNDEVARKNLRNTIYKIKQTLGEDLIISPQKHLLQINKNLSVESDLNWHGTAGDSKGSHKRYDFLNGFTLSGTESKFEEWVLQKRVYYQNQYLNNLLEAANDKIQQKLTQELEVIISKMISLDELDEEPYKLLMKYYIANGIYYKAVDLYSKLSEVLERELSIQPGQDIIDLWKLAKLSHSDKIKSRKVDVSFIGREDELNQLNTALRGLGENDRQKAYLIMGETGIGKTRLVDELVEDMNDQVLIFRTKCYLAEKSYFYKSWNNVLSKIAVMAKELHIEVPKVWDNFVTNDMKISSDQIDQKDNVLNFNNYQYQMLEDAIVQVMVSVSGKKPLVLLIDDLQWMDELGLSLLNNLLAHGSRRNMMIAVTVNEDVDNTFTTYSSNWIRQGLVGIIHLNRLTRQEIKALSNGVLPECRNIDALIDKIYKETQGNTFFVLEYLNCLKGCKNDAGFSDCFGLTPNMENVINSRFLQVSEDARQILAFCALFFDYISLDMLADLSGKDTLEIITIIEELEKKNIIKESVNSGEIRYEFTHQKLREFMNTQISGGRKQIYHGKILKKFKLKLRKDKSDQKLYSDLVYHATHAGELIDALKYMVLNAKSFFDYDHEFFPIIENVSIVNHSIDLPNEYSLHYFSKIEEMMKVVQKKYKMTNEIRVIIQEYYFLKGRYYIHIGKYDDGILLIQSMIEDALETDSHDAAIEGYRQMSYYCRQINDVEGMKFYIQKGLEIAREHKKNEQQAVLYRLSGLALIMAGKFNEAEQDLLKSQKLFLKLEKWDVRFVLNIAAAENYLGDLRRLTGKLDEALKFYEHAIEICDSQNISHGIYMFLNNAGMVACELNDFEAARQYFQRSLEIYDRSTAYWGRSIALAYDSYLNIKNGNLHEASAKMKEANQYLQVMKSPYEKQIVSKLMEKIEKEEGVEITSKLRKELRN